MVASVVIWFYAVKIMNAGTPSRPEKLLGMGALSVLAVYWLVTLLYVSPNNPIRVQFLPQLAFFERFFFQRWEFFAPPPMYNERIYFIFEPLDGEDGNEVTVEVGDKIY